MSFEEAGQAPGLEIWRIEDFEAVPYDKSKYGKFHVGDSYIVLKTVKRGSRLAWDLHFWLGAETTQDEYGTAAIKSVELDDSLGGTPVQHREVQDHESNLFESYFKKGIKYLPGGVKSGFTHVDPEAVEKRLFQVKGKRNIKVKQVDLDPSALNKNDCFILDCGKGHDVLVYMPKGSSRMERFKATRAANEIRDEDHAGDANVVILDAGGDEEAKFFEELGSGSADDVSDSSSSEDDAAAERSANSQVTLYKVSSDGGDGVEITEVSGKPLNQGLLNQSDLQSQDCFILNTGSTSGIFAWIGKEASKDERVQAMKSAESFLEKSGLPKWTKVERVVDNGETAMFKQFFSSWKEEEDCPYTGLGRVYPPEIIAEWDVGSLHAENRRRLAKSAGAAIGFMPDDSKGQKEIFRIEDFEMVPLEEEKHGMFFGGDSYVIKYSYEKEGRPAYIVYFWQGGESSQDEKAASAINAVRVDDELCGKAVQVRVVQGREPRHFIKMFGGKMIVYSGGKASGFKNVHDHDTYDVDGTRMFCVRGTSADDVRATQVPEVAASLNSEDVFILETPNNTWIWTGQASNEDEQSIAAGMSELVSPGRDAETIQEGSEPEDFWNAIGGQGEYSKVAVDFDKPILDPRLFHCQLMANGNLKAVEINNFEQDDMRCDDVMILDSGDEIYVWIGNEATDEEKSKGLDLAKKYLATDPTERDEKNTLIFTIKQGDEPSSFTCVFPSFGPLEG